MTAGNTQPRSGHLASKSVGPNKQGSASTLPDLLDQPKGNRTSTHTRATHSAGSLPSGGSDPKGLSGRGYMATQPGASGPTRKISDVKRVAGPSPVNGPSGPSEPSSRRRSSSKD